MTMEDTIRIRRQKLVISVTVMLFAGIIYAWTILNAPFKLTGDIDGAQSVINYTQLGLNYTMTVIFFCLGGVFSGAISKQTSTTLRFTLSAILVFSSYFISSLLIVTIPVTGNYIELYLAYGMLGGLGLGMAYNTVISTINLWFPDRRGFCSGLTFMGFGLSLLLLGRLIDIMGRSELIGWRSTYVIVAITLGLVFLTAAIFLKPPPGDAVFPAAKSDGNDQTNDEPRDYSALQMIKRPSFIMILIYAIILMSIGITAISFASDIMTGLGATGSIAVTAVGLYGVFNGAGRLISGFLFDSHGIKKTQLISSAVAILAPVTLISAVSGNSVFLGIIGICICGLTNGFAPITCSVFASGFYGSENFPLNFSILSMAMIPASFAATLAGSIRTSSGGFLTAFIVLAILSVVGFIVNLGIRKP